MTDVRTSTSGLLWAGSEDLYAAVLEHPFLAGLTDGTLPRDAFRHYVVQDTHYLRGYARALRALAARAPDEPSAAMFAEHAVGAVAVEQGLHEEFLDDLDGAPVDAVPPGPTTRAYVDHLLTAVHTGSWAEGVAAVLPCYWVYREVGRELLPRSSPDPLYARWVAAYGGDDFSAVVDAVLDLTDRLAPGPREQALMESAFRTSTRYEWMFWDASWRLEGWPL
ncbi:thiaminase II [Vallicoccus soli]|uniref:thiaminase II n=1 Tax=Vallicoccus soli TaxID=2339232 RepID=UPI001C498547|nr:thiaminase II [Vallicoccus soli]